MDCGWILIVVGVCRADHFLHGDPVRDQLLFPASSHHWLLLPHRAGHLPPRKRASRTGEEDERHLAAIERQRQRRDGRVSHRQMCAGQHYTLGGNVDALRCHCPARSRRRSIENHSTGNHPTGTDLQNGIYLQPHHFRHLSSQIPTGECCIISRLI